MLPPSHVLPAIGQGALGLEMRKADIETQRLLSFLDHSPTRIRVTAERAFLRRLEGGCQVPIAAHAELREGGLHLEGMVAGLNGRPMIRDAITGAPEDSETLGEHLAERLLSRGAGKILQELYAEGIKGDRGAGGG